jgi:phospholipid transport system substrate-binding protein
LSVFLAATVLQPDARAQVPPVTADAEAVVVQLQSGLLRIDRDQAGRPLSARVAAFAPLIAGTHDLEYMGRLALGRQWPKLSAEQQRQFQELFDQLSERDYAQRFRDTAGARFTITRTAAVGGSRVQVDTTLAAPGEPPMALQYLLHQTPGGWRIINILAEGVSELALQRTQYQRILKAQGFSGLVSHMQQRLQGSSGN